MIVVIFNPACSLTRSLARISHAPVRNAHRVPTFVGASRERIRPGEPLPRRLAAGDLLTNCKICEKVRLVLCVALSFVSACSKKGFDERSLGPPEVLVTEVTQQDVPV